MASSNAELLSRAQIDPSAVDIENVQADEKVIAMVSHSSIHHNLPHKAIGDVLNTSMDCRQVWMLIEIRIWAWAYLR